MTDETPTERFDAAGNGAADLPTERLTPADAAAVDGTGAVVQEERKSRKLMIILGSVGGALLIILIILLILLLVRPGSSVTPTGSPTPSPTASSASPTPTRTGTATASPTPTPTPTPTQTVAPPPPSNDVEIDSFDATNEVDCSSQTQNPEFVEFTWSSTNGIVAYFAVGNTNDAEQNGMGWTLPPNGGTSDFPSGYFPFEYQCSNESITYTITIVGTNGSRDSAHVTVENVGDTF